MENNNDNNSEEEEEVEEEIIEEIEIEEETDEEAEASDNNVVDNSYYPVSNKHEVFIKNFCKKLINDVLLFIH